MNMSDFLGFYKRRIKKHKYLRIVCWSIVLTARGVKMRKLVLLFMLFVAVVLVFAAGCGKEESGKKITSRPVAAKPVGAEPSAPAESPADVPETTSEAPSEAPVEARSVVPAGSADCEQLSSAELGEVAGGTWTKTTDCPQRPTMPKGVSVCRCDYDSPKQLYFNVETQLYGDTAEANRVFDMYCKGVAAANVTADKSCSVLRTNDLRPNYVYFLKGNYFVKVSCLGGTCPIAMVEAVADKVAGKI
jgi:hypothetical protein